MRAFLLSMLATALLACADELPAHVDLLPAAENVEIAVERPGTDGYALVGTVTGVAAANDLEVAQDAARNDLRNKAAALGASLVTIDQNLGEAMPLQNKTRVRMVGRAYKALD